MALSFNLTDKPSSLGHHFIVGLSGTELDEWDKQILGKLKPAGVLLLKRNFDHKLPYSEWLAKLAALQKQIRNYLERDELIISLDHEGGKVHRAPAPITHFPPARKYAGHAAQVAKCMALELKSLGVNLSWAPLADIHSNPKNPIIGERAFSSDPQEVAEIAAAFAASLAENGIAACAKHYPGHGDTSTDSHLELPCLEMNLQQLRARELLPFKALVDMQVPMIMTAHILFPQIDKKCPATLSQVLLKEVLRQEYAYKGVIVSDDLDMKAVSDGFKNEENIGRAINAGCDMFIVARHPDSNTDRPLVLAKYLQRCLRERILSESSLHQCHQRINAFFTETLKKYEPEVLAQERLECHLELARSLA